jgi:hypothetical protein
MIRPPPLPVRGGNGVTVRVGSAGATVGVGGTGVTVGGIDVAVGVEGSGVTDGAGTAVAVGDTGVAAGPHALTRPTNTKDNNSLSNLTVLLLSMDRN